MNAPEGQTGSPTSPRPTAASAAVRWGNERRSAPCCGNAASLVTSAGAAAPARARTSASAAPAPISSPPRAAAPGSAGSTALDLGRCRKERR